MLGFVFGGGSQGPKYPNKLTNERTNKRAGHRVVRHPVDGLERPGCVIDKELRS